jgi:phosphate transport system permease protein
MAQAEFSLRVKDRKRLLKDRIARFAVTAGGISVLGALVLIFVYLAMVVGPLFSDAELDRSAPQKEIALNDPQMMAVDEYGSQVFVLNKDGRWQFWSSDPDISIPTEEGALSIDPDRLAFTTPESGWFAALDKQGHLQIARPTFRYNVTDKGRVAVDSLEYFAIPTSLSDQLSAKHVVQFSFAMTNDAIYLALVTGDGHIEIWTQGLNRNQDLKIFTFPIEVNVDQLLLTPDGQTLFIRDSNDLAVAIKTGDHYQVREMINLVSGAGKDQHSIQVKQMTLLSGAYSLLVTYNDGWVTQWFDVLDKKEQKRSLSMVRGINLGKEAQFILPNTFSKGFFSFFADGSLRNDYTTSGKVVLNEPFFDTAPQLAAMSSNEKFLATYSDHHLNFSAIDMAYPEISFSALWQKVWYESYQEPGFVWQSTAASDDFEAKFSIVPILFGTIKAAVFAMLFSVPIAVMSAIYTAYFMTPSMRSFVKPTIELMEALPTVIIGFLAGLWFAPIVERHLVSFSVLIILLPLLLIFIGAMWCVAPKRWRSVANQGWHAAILIPLIVIIIACAMPLSVHFESWLFDGDVRVFLADYGINFDQRNALVVGLAMGFAVIPTIFTIAEDAVFSVPKHLSDGSLALGATQWQTLTHVVLLTASPGIFSAIMMGLGRAVGETMIVLMATGNTPIMDWNILEGMRTLAATIAVELPESAVGNSHYRLLFLAALLLFVFTFVVNSIAEWVRLRLREKYRAL